MKVKLQLSRIFLHKIFNFLIFNQKKYQRYFVDIICWKKQANNQLFSILATSFFEVRTLWQQILYQEIMLTLRFYTMLKHRAFV